MRRSAKMAVAAGAAFLAAAAGAAVSAALAGVLRVAGSYLLVLALFAAAPGALVLTILQARSAPPGIGAKVFAGLVLAATAYFGFELSFGYALFPIHSRESTTRSNLAYLRAAVGFFKGDNRGRSPAALSDLIPRYTDQLPDSFTMAHSRNDRVAPLTADDYAARRFSDTGGWGFVTSGPKSGTVFVDCTHTDLKGTAWTSY